MWLPIIFCFLSILRLSDNFQLLSLLSSSASFIQQSVKYHTEQASNTKFVLSSYDYIVVGGGTAGCVMASRLSEDPQVTVLLLEAGRDESFIMDIPIVVSYLQLLDVNWGYRTQPQPSACLGLRDGRCNYPRGKVLGGSSVLNWMAFTRGNRKDFDGWRDLGNPGWGFDDILPYFIKLEDLQIPEYRYSGIRGTNGPVKVSENPYKTNLAHSFLDAGEQIGYRVVDYNGFDQTGLNYLQATSFNGTRYSSNRAYLAPVRNRKNLHVKKFAMVTKVLINFKTKRAYGVEYTSSAGISYKVLAKREVILCAGAIGTPQLLMLSGIGPREHLQSLNIKVIQDLKVGYNLQDHIAFGGVIYTVEKNDSIIFTRIIDNFPKMASEFFDRRNGPLTVPGGFEGIAFVNTKLNTETYDYPDIELMYFGASSVSDPTLPINFGVKKDLYDTVYKPIEKRDTMMLMPMIMRPKSKGRILLKSKNPFKHPLIYPNYLTEGDDLDVLVEGTKIAIALAETEAFRKYGVRLNTIPYPACRRFVFGSDDYWRCAIRQLTLTIYHQCGTAKMGTDPEAVVDPELRVYGIKGLRVVDASIMPFVPTAHINAVVFMIAEKAADLIKESWGVRSYYYK